MMSLFCNFFAFLYPKKSLSDVILQNRQYKRYCTIPQLARCTPPHLAREGWVCHTPNIPIRTVRTSSRQKGFVIFFPTHYFANLFYLLPRCYYMQQTQRQRKVRRIIELGKSEYKEYCTQISDKNVHTEQISLHQYASKSVSTLYMAGFLAR